MAREWENYVANILDAMNVYYVREVTFGAYRADFVLVGLDIVIEIDGPEHTKVLHKKRDNEKDSIYQSRGFTVLRISNYALDTDIDNTVAYLIARIKARQAEYS